jgi:hypothetical protein
MESEKADMFIMTNAKFFESHHLHLIRDRLIKTDNSKWGLITTLQFSDPTVSLIVSLIAGYLGIDRFIIGDTGLGIAKLLTCGGAGVWWFVDWFLIMNATKERNMTKLHQFLF